MGIPRQRSVDALLVLIVALFAAVSRGNAYECTSSLEDQLLLAEEGTIWRVDVDGENREVLAVSPSAFSLDYSYTRDTLYWSDINTRHIYAFKDKSSKPKVAIPEQKSWLPFSLAVDSVSDKIYVVDSFSGTVHIFDLANDANHGIILSGNLTGVKDVELDIYEGYLFVLDKYQILRTDLDGANPLVIYSEYINIDDVLGHTSIPEGLSSQYSRQQGAEDTKTYRAELSVSDVTVDPKSKRIFWVNSLTRSIHSSNYEGNDRRIHFQENEGSQVFESLASLTYLDGKLYWADDVSQKVYKVDVNNESENSIILNNVHPLVIRSVSCSSQHQVPNPCANDNGRCQHLCVLSRSSKDNFRCACNVGYQLAKDEKSCVSVQDFLLFTQHRHVRGKSLDSDGKTSVDVINPSKIQVGNAAILDFNAKDELIYHNSLFPNNHLHQVSLDSGEDTILRPDLLSKDVRNLAYDWTTKNLYYFTYYYADYTTLSVLNVEDPTYSKIVVDNVTRLVRAITVHPNRGYIYFAQLIDDRGSISRTTTDGSGLTVLIDLELHNSPEGLAIDYDEDRLYWSEIKKSEEDKWQVQIRHSNLDGTDIKELPLPEDLERPTSLAIQGDWIYVIAGPEKILVRLNKKTGSDATTLIDAKELNSLSGVKFFSRAIQSIRTDHPCVKGIGECEKFCFAVPNSEDGLKGVCGCPYGEKLAENGKTCVDNSREEPPFVPCKFTSFKCNKQRAAV